MGRIVRDGVQAYEVVDEERGIVREANFGASVVSEMEAGLPMAFGIANFFYKIFLKGYIAVRNRVVPAEELEAILLKEEEKKKMQFGSGIVGAFSGLMFTLIWMQQVSFQIIRALWKKGVAKIKKMRQEKSDEAV